MTKSAIELDDAVTIIPQEKPSFRSLIRDAVLDSKCESEIVQCFGVEIEIRSPDLEALLQYRNVDPTADRTIMARAMIDNCWVPGSNEKVFEEADVESIMKLPFTGDMRKLQKAITKVLGGDEAIITGIEDNTKSH